MASASTCELLARLSVSRDPVAWSCLVERHGEGMRRAAAAAAGSTVADDAVQEALLQIRDRAGRFSVPEAGDPERAATGWLRAVAVRCALTLARSAASRKRRERRLEATAMADTTTNDPAVAVMAAEQRQAITSALAALPDNDRAAIVLRFYGGIEGKEALGQALGCSASAAGVRLHRALERLRQRLAASGCVLAPTSIGSALAEAAEVPAAPAAEVRDGWNQLLDQPVGSALSARSAFPHPENLLMRLALFTAAGLLLATAIGILAQAQDAPVKPDPTPGNDITRIELHEVHGLHGGINLVVHADGTFVASKVSIVNRPARNREGRIDFPATLAKAQIARLADYKETPRPGIPDESRPLIRVVFRDGSIKEHAKWGQDKSPLFDPAYASLKQVAEEAPWTKESESTYEP